MLVFEFIVEKLFEKKNNDKAAWLKNYVKHNIDSLGVGMPEIRKIVIEAENKFRISKKSTETQFQFLNKCMENNFTEVKLVAIIYLELFGNALFLKEKMKLFSEWFNKRYIFDWNICDWLCVKLISPMLDSFPKEVKTELNIWNSDGYLWTARASLVPFSYCKGLIEHKETIYNFSKKLIQREERFCKTAVGWVLREYSKKDLDFVEKLILDFNIFISPEVKRNALKYVILQQKN